MKVAQQKVRVKIPRGIKPADRELLARDIINFIRKRTKDDNIDKQNQDFQEYSDEYADWKGSERVNLTLSGDMLDNLKFLRSDSGFVTIGYEEGYEGMGKVHGNRNGTYGNQSPVTAPRDFLGVTEADIKDVVEKYKVDQRDAMFEENIAQQARELTREQVERLRRSNTFRNLGLNDDF